jgi:hypothetical protein
VFLIGGVRAGIDSGSKPTAPDQPASNSDRQQSSPLRVDDRDRLR